MKRLKITVHGTVQGVFYRVATKETADVLGVTGVVKNNDDGTVEITAEGADSALQRLLEWAEEGPDSAEVTKVEHVWREPTGAFDDFQVSP